MTNEPTNANPHDLTPADDIRDFPERFPTRDAWDRYCDFQASRCDDFTREVESDDDAWFEIDDDFAADDDAPDSDVHPYGWDVEQEELPW